MVRRWCCSSVALNKSKGKDGGWIVVTAAWGIAVAVPAYIFGSISGAHMNPAVTIGNAIAGNFPWQNVAGYIIAQMLGAFTGAALVWLTYLPHWKATEDKATKLGGILYSSSNKRYKSKFYN